MALEMRDHCERCAETLPYESEAYICSYECTFCKRCSTGMEAVCPNCRGELLRRPRRRAKS